jgi:RHS repeat-associated protein
VSQPPRYYGENDLHFLTTSVYRRTRRLASTPSRSVYYDGAYAPYGESYAESGTTDHSFTGQNQDVAPSGQYPLYDFMAREYNPTWGRWLSPDPKGGNVLNPQSFNRYAYVDSNPLSLTDPLGQEPCPEVWSSEGWQGNNYPGSNGSASCGGGAVTIDSNGDPLSSYITAGEAAYANPLNIQFLNQSGLSQQGTWTIGGMSYSWMPGQFAQNGGLIHLTTGYWTAAGAATSPVFYQLGTWKLQTKVFVSTLGQNFVDEFKSGGCVDQFLTDLTGEGPEPLGAAPEDVVRSVGQNAAAVYALSRGLVVPLRSSVYRGILSGTETWAGYAAMVPFDISAGKAFINEMLSMGRGGCQ